jgi:hypothetical protein
MEMKDFRDHLSSDPGWQIHIWMLNRHPMRNSAYYQMINIVFTIEPLLYRHQQ